MIHRRTIWAGLCATLALAATARGQGVPAIPGAPAVPAAPAAPGNLWSFLLPNADQKAACKTHFCNSAIGKLINGAAGPIGAMSGGLLGKRCEVSGVEDAIKNKPADDPDGLAARVKKDEAEAKVRRANVRFLGTVDCNYWPEAIDTLKTALRKDRNECVRFEAALALQSGCCCNNEIIDALTNCVMGEKKTDPHPAERSERVRAAAAEALARCPVMQEKKVDEKTLTRQPAPELDASEYYKKVAGASREDMVAKARAVLASAQRGAPGSTVSAGGADVAPLPGVAPIPVRGNSVSGIFANAFATGGYGTRAREPFFAGLTRALMGQQETMAPPSPQPMPTPMPNKLPPIQPKPVDMLPPPTSETPRPFSISQEQPSVPMETPPSFPLDERKPASMDTPRPFPDDERKPAALEPSPSFPLDERNPTSLDAPRPSLNDEIMQTTATLPPSLPPTLNPDATQPAVPHPFARVDFPPPQPVPDPALADAPSMAIRVFGPSRAILGKTAEYEIQVANQSRQPFHKIVLYAWLPDGLSHAAGSEIQGEVITTIAPGESRKLRVPTEAIRQGRGTLRVKVVTTVGEVSATQEVEVVSPEQGDAPAAKLGFVDRSDVQTTEPPTMAGPPRPLEIVQPHSARQPAGRSFGTVGSVTIEEPRPTSGPVLGNTIAQPSSH